MALTRKQLKFIEIMLANPTLPNIKLAELAGINPCSIYDWKKQPEFNEEVKKRLRELWEDGEKVAVKTMLNLATNGDFKASKYILDSLGYAPTQKIDANLSTDVVINIE